MERAWISLLCCAVEAANRKAILTDKWWREDGPVWSAPRALGRSSSWSDTPCPASSHTSPPCGSSAGLRIPLLSPAIQRKYETSLKDEGQRKKFWPVNIAPRGPGRTAPASQPCTPALSRSHSWRLSWQQSWKWKWRGSIYDLLTLSCSYLENRVESESEWGSRYDVFTLSCKHPWSHLCTPRSQLDCTSASPHSHTCNII